MHTFAIWGPARAHAAGVHLRVRVCRQLAGKVDFDVWLVKRAHRHHVGVAPCHQLQQHLMRALHATAAAAAAMAMQVGVGGSGRHQQRCWQQQQ